MFARHMLSFSTAAALVCVLLLALPSAALADPAGRVALVIGNSDYRAAPLKNPANDAEDVAKKLGQLGFSVIHLKDVRFKPMVEAFQDFAQVVLFEVALGLPVISRVSAVVVPKCFRSTHFSMSLEVKRQVARHEMTAFAHRHAVLEGVFQLAHIPRPGISVQLRKKFRRHSAIR